MTNLLVQEVERKFKKDKLPEVTPGAIIKIHQKIKEGEKERIQIFEGLIIAINHGHGASKTMTVRKMVQGIGVEKIFPINSPSIAKIEVIRVGKVRRGKLYYMRGIQGKAAKLKEKMGAKKRMLLNMLGDDNTPTAEEARDNSEIVTEAPSTENTAPAENLEQKAEN